MCGRFVLTSTIVQIQQSFCDEDASFHRAVLQHRSLPRCSCDPAKQWRLPLHRNVLGTNALMS